MGILDEAIREHLDLKRQHGADDSELKKLEDSAFGPPERPGASEAVSDPEAEAPTEFMAEPGLDDGAEAPEPSESPSSRREPAAGLADIQEGPEPVVVDDEELAADEDDDEDLDDEPAEEEQPAGEHETVPEKPIEPVGHSTEERHAIADQPTQMYDVEEGFASTEAPAPPDEDLVAEEISEARLGPVEPIAPVDDEEDEDDDFFDEQRLSDELDQALEAPVEEDEDDEIEEPDEDDAEPAEAEKKTGEPAAEGDSEHDPLEDTPDFLEEAPEDDQLWFEQKPPKDFDFDD